MYNLEKEKFDSTVRARIYQPLLLHFAVCVRTVALRNTARTIMHHWLRKVLRLDSLDEQLIERVGDAAREKEIIPASQPRRVTKKRKDGLRQSKNSFLPSFLPYFLPSFSAALRFCLFLLKKFRTHGILSLHLPPPFAT